MSLPSKLKTIIVILKIFYWYAFKGIIKSYYRHKTANRYLVTHSDAPSTGGSIARNTSESTTSGLITPKTWHRAKL